MSASGGGMGVKHLQVRLTTEEYDRYNEVAGEGKMQSHLRGLILREISMESQPDPLDALPARHRAVVTKLIDLLRSESLTQQQRDNLAISVNSTIKLLEGRE